MNAATETHNPACDACACASPQRVPVASELGGITGFSRGLFKLFGLVLLVIVSIAIAGEWFGLIDRLNRYLPWLVWLGIIVISGYPIFRNVLAALRKFKITAHTLMTLGLIAAVFTGEWTAAVLVVFFMRLADYVEHFTVTSARLALTELIAAAPQMARVERAGKEIEIPVTELQIGETVVVRPGEKVPVDGEVVSGAATINQAAITGEAMPLEAAPGTQVFAASLVQLGSIRVRATRVGEDTTFGQVIRLVAEAEGNRADVQRIADRFSTYYLPVVVIVAALTFVISRNVLATAAVLMVACSCSFALATPVAVVASMGTAAKRGLLIKGGKYLEALARADVILIDKTGTLTLGRPRIVDIVPLVSDVSREQLLFLAATAERYSEHPLAEAVRNAASTNGTELGAVDDFKVLAGFGVQARIDAVQIVVGSPRLMPSNFSSPKIMSLEAEGKILLCVLRNRQPIGILAATDTLRSEVPEAIGKLRALGIQHLELITGDHKRSAASIAEPLAIPYRAELLPEQKIAIVREYQNRGHVVIMVGDGINDGPALAQADVGVAMGAIGTGTALEIAHVVLMREDWLLVPELLMTARNTMNVVKLNLGFTAVYNLIGLALAASGLLPPIFAAAAQSLPDFGILSNSARLFKTARTVH